MSNLSPLYPYHSGRFRCKQAGWTSLFHATHHDESAIVGKLLINGANPEHTDKQGFKAVQWGEYMGFEHTCRVIEDFQSSLSIF